VSKNVEKKDNISAQARKLLYYTSSGTATKQQLAFERVQRDKDDSGFSIESRYVQFDGVSAES
jgi:hypothetical protein